MNNCTPLSLEEARELVEENKNNQNFVVLDVRTPEELKYGVLGNPINLDIYEPDFHEKMDKLDKEKTYLVYCRSGNRSKMAISVMGKLGFKSVYEIDEGIMS